MNILYKYLAPFLADTFGFQEMVDVTDGLGILDDCSGYKGKVSRTDVNEPYMGSRMVTSDIRMEDVIGGTKAKLLDTFRRSTHRVEDPKFVILSTAPVASMIGTDLEDVADAISKESGLPATSVELGGHKFYDHGLSETMLALGKLLIEPVEEKIPHGINLLGGNAIDWSAQTVRDVRRWANSCGLNVISQWGGSENTENLKQAAKAEINLVTAASGLALAKWMKREYGIPYIAAAPFGKDWAQRIARALLDPSDTNALSLPADPNPAHILILGEQLTSNAIRNALREKGMGGAHVATFFTFDKSLSQAGDKRLKGEEALKELLDSGVYDLVIGDSDLSLFSPEGLRWIDLPHGAVRYSAPGSGFPKLDNENLNCWLDSVLV